MKIIKDNIEIAELKEMTKKMDRELVKAMVDIEKGIMAVDAPMHADLLEFLIQEEDSESKNLWGINIHPDKTGDDFIEFDSMMNFKPGLGNTSRYVEDEKVRNAIVSITNNMIKK